MELLEDLNRLWDEGTEKSDIATRITETDGRRTRTFIPLETGVLIVKILDAETAAAKAGQPAQHDKATIARARALIRLAQWHKQTPEEREEADE